MNNRTVSAFLILLLSSALLPVVAASQVKSNPDKEPQEEYKVVCRYRIIWIDVGVRDNHGNEVRDLTKDNFTIYEDGEKQALIEWHRIESMVKGQPHTRYSVVYYYNSRTTSGYRKVRVVVEAQDKPKLKVKTSPERYYATKDSD